MKHIKSERLKKFETELQDLEQWLKLGLVPKKDIEKHKVEIEQLKSKIEEEKERLLLLKENGDPEEFVAPKKQAPRPGYTEMPTIPDIDAGETALGMGDSAFDLDSEINDGESSYLEDRDDHEEEDEGTKEEDDEEEEKDDEEESYFSDKNRWRRGGIVDPEADDW